MDEYFIVTGLIGAVQFFTRMAKKERLDISSGSAGFNKNVADIKRMNLLY